MMLGAVRGTVVMSTNADRADRGRYLLVSPTGPDGSFSRGKAESLLLALDLVGAERGQVVLVSQGSSARNAGETRNAAVDAVVVGIVDLVDVAGRKEAYRAP